MLDRLTLDQLRILVTVADTGSFSAAARQLGRVQSAISQSVQGLESALGISLFDREGKIPKLNDAGRVILAGARHMIDSAEMLKMRAESIAAEVEPELTLAVDAMFPMPVLTKSLRGLSEAFSCLPVTLFTEGLGGAEQRLREGAARLAFCLPLPSMAAEHVSEFLVDIPTVPVVAAGHPLAGLEGPIPRSRIEEEVQLVLTDRTPLTAGVGGSILSLRTWRFADLGTRLEFLVGGFGWCNMPVHMVRQDIDVGRLKILEIAHSSPPKLPLHIVYPRGRPPGKAGRWLIEEIQHNMPLCAEPMSLPAKPKVMALAAS